MKVVLPLDGSFRLVTREFVLPYTKAALVSSSQPSTKYYFPHHTLFRFVFPIVQQAGQAVVPRRLSLNMCLCSNHTPLDLMDFYICRTCRTRCNTPAGLSSSSSCT
jgi:hypothetical protein